MSKVAAAVVLVGSLVTAACSAPEPDPLVCSRPTGLVEVTYTKVFGDCPDWPTVTVQYEVAPREGCVVEDDRLVGCQQQVQMNCGGLRYQVLSIQDNLVSMHGTISGQFPGCSGIFDFVGARR